MLDKLKFPLFFLRDKGGVVCLESATEGEEVFTVPVFTDVQHVRAFVARNAFTVSCLFDELSLGKFLRMLDRGIQWIALDPKSGGNDATWEIGVDELIERLPESEYVWDYPVFVIQTGPEEWARIQGKSEFGSEVACLVVFSDEDLAERYIRNVARGGEAVSLPSATEFATFLRCCQECSPHVAAVAFDVTEIKPGRTARHCLHLGKLIERLSQSP